MSNQETQRRAIEAVRRFEARRGRTANRVPKGAGYDLCSKGRGGHRHIEVKGTARRRMTQRWLEPKEYTAYREDRRFWLYVVTNVGDRAKVQPFRRSELEARFLRKETKYWFRLDVFDR